MLRLHFLEILEGQFGMYMGVKKHDTTRSKHETIWTHITYKLCTRHKYDILFTNNNTM